MARAHIAPEDLQDHDNRIPFTKYVGLMRAGKELANDPALALHYGEAVSVDEFSIVGLIGRASETPREAFAQLNRYVRLIVDVDLGGAGDRFQAELGPDGVWMTDTRANPNGFLELTESAFAHMVCWSRLIGLKEWAWAVHVTHAEPPYRAEYDRIFQAPVVFGSKRNALLLDPNSGDHWVARLPRYAFGILSARAQTLLESLERSQSMRTKVESLLIPMLHTGEVSIDLVAGKMDMSRQTLFRKLKAEGVTFEQALDELRHQMALHYLGGKKVSVNQTAYLVGFSDPTAFSRAFKRWTGMSPSAMRASER